MIGVSQLYWIAIGAGLVLLVETLGWLYWRYWGAGSIRDYVSEEEEPDGDYRIISKINTPVQRIALVEHEEQMLLYGNGDVMVGTTEDEDMYAEALIHVPMAIACKRIEFLSLAAVGELQQERYCAILR